MGSGSPRAGAAPGLEETDQHLEGQLPQGGCAGQSGAVGRGVGAQRCPLRLRGRLRQAGPVRAGSGAEAQVSCTGGGGPGGHLGVRA